jgi:hypothetical protein
MKAVVLVYFISLSLSVSVMIRRISIITLWCVSDVLCVCFRRSG